MTNLSPEQTAKTSAKFAEFLGNVAGSHNADSVNQKSHTCVFCGFRLTLEQRQQRGRRFCSHACYVDFLRAKPIAPRLWSQVEKTATCWIWMGARTGGSSVRHGQIMWRARYQSPQKVHRVVWELARGPIPDGLQINHHCDNPICVRLDHLYLGTQDENMGDAARRNRLTVPRTRTFSLIDRLNIYRAKPYRGICVDLARKYGVTKACISHIRKGRFIGSGVWARTKESAWTGF